MIRNQINAFETVLNILFSLKEGPAKIKRGHGLKTIRTFRRGRGRPKVYHYRNIGFRPFPDEVAKEVIFYLYNYSTILKYTLS